MYFRILLWASFRLVFCSLTVLSSAFVLLSPYAIAQQIQFFVAVDGNDANPGTIAEPFATLERARDAVRQRNQDDDSGKPTEVVLRGSK